MTEDHTTERRAALALLKAGAANLSEVARLAGVSRQAVRAWVVAADLDWQAAREKHLVGCWRRIMRSKRS